MSKVVVVRGRDALRAMAGLVAAADTAVPNGRDPGESPGRLAHLGLIWETPGPDHREPGNPSPCACLAGKVAVPALPTRKS